MEAAGTSERTGPTVFVTSVVELDRRLRAYTTLIASLLGGVAVSSLDFLVAAPGVWLACVGGLALALALSRAALVRSFRGYARMELRLGQLRLERVRGETAEEFRLADVVGLRVVRTRRQAVREVTAKLSDGRRLSVNGIADFDRFERELRDRVGPGAAVTEAREPVDYDHPLFYVVFGVLTGLALTVAARAMATLSQGGLLWATRGVALYSLLFGVYAVVGRPLSQRYGPKSRLGDFLLGGAALLAGLVIAARSFVR